MPSRRNSKILEDEDEEQHEKDGSDGDVIDESAADHELQQFVDACELDDDEEDEEDEGGEGDCGSKEKENHDKVGGDHDSSEDGSLGECPESDHRSHKVSLKSVVPRESAATTIDSSAASDHMKPRHPKRKPKKAKGAASVLPKDRGVGASSDDEELPAIKPGDSSDEEGPEHKSRVGNIPLRWYKDFDHVGYDIDGNKIVRKLKADAIDTFIKKKDDPEFWRTVYDARNDEELRLNDDEVRFLRRLQKNKFEQGYEEYAPYEDWFFPTRDEMPDRRDMYLPKRRFIPSKWENKKIVALVRAIRNGNFKIKEAAPERNYDLWLGTSAEVGSKMGPRIEAPKMKLPTHAESYNPPAEYLLSPEEQQQWKAAHPDDRKTNFLPQKYSALRLTPAYPPLMRERFERCLDLYLAPRAIKKRMQVDPTDLLPQLPRPEELKPFPCRLGREYVGHRSVVTCVDVHCTGQYIVTGSKDCTAKVLCLLLFCAAFHNLKRCLICRRFGM
jgi:ribosome biogenesis protein ERB1